MFNQYTWGDKEPRIIAAVKAHREWLNENRERVEQISEEKGLDFKKILEAIDLADATVERYLELGEDREISGYRSDGEPCHMSGHLRMNVFSHTNNFRVLIGRRLGMDEVFALPKW